MAKVYLLLCFTLLASLHSKEIFIVAGQSNSWRLSQVKSGKYKLPYKLYYFGMRCTSEPKSAVLKEFTSISEKSMSLGLITKLMEIHQKDIVLVQYSRCGAGLWDKTSAGWFPGKNPQRGSSHEKGLCRSFEQYIQSVKDQLKEMKVAWKPHCLFWHQGESDSRKPQELPYFEKRLVDLFYRLQRAIGVEVPIIIGEIRELNDNCKFVNKVLKKYAEANPRRFLVNTQDLTYEDKLERKNVHFDFQGIFKLGQRMASKYQSYLKNR
jgi:hypothetical protein